MRKSFLSDSSMPAIGAALLLAASSFAPSSAHAQAAAGDTQADERSTGLTDIIVTAQKREQNLQDVPVAVTALATDALAVNRVQNVADLNAIVPNLTVQRTGGGSGIPGITLRGILSLGVAPGADRQVGMYLDGVYIGHAQSSLFDVAEIQRIEVLRGPQGTLFGRNATAGAISIITHDPLGRFDLSQETSIGNFA